MNVKSSQVQGTARKSKLLGCILHGLYNTYMKFETLLASDKLINMRNKVEIYSRYADY